jgi:hypothetical protein
MRRRPESVLRNIGARFAKLAGISWASLAVAGCADDTTSLSTGGEALAHWEYCEALCGLRTSCSPGQTTLRSCMASCENDPTRAQFNGQVWTGQSECLATQSCAALRGGSAFEVCFDVALAALVPSDACIDFCSTDSAQSFECGGGYSVRDCVTGSFCTWHDDVLARGALCNSVAADCEARAACLAAIFGP